MISVPVVIAVASVVTYFWRALGTYYAGGVSAESRTFRYFSCIAYAMIGALIFKLIVYPQGVASETTLVTRLLAAGAALALFYACRRNVAVGAWGGAGALWLIHSGGFEI